MKRRRSRRRDRRGVILVLTALLLVMMVALLAFAIDVGYLQVAKTQLQQAADAAALAATAELIDDEALASGSTDLSDEIALARSRAVQYGAANPVCAAAPIVDPNSSNSTTGNVVVGYLANPSDQSQTMNFGKLNQQANAVQVTVVRSSTQNGEVGLFFGRIFGNNSNAVSATATAALLNNIKGFKAPTDGSKIGILPFALDVDTWNNMLHGGGTDDYAWNNSTKSISNGSDGVHEVNLYPQGTGAPGNRGTVDIGSSNNSTADIARQIVYGVNSSDLSNMPNGQIALNDSGTLDLNGDTGISAGVKDELASIEGQPRMIPLFKSVSGPGNNAQYTICAFVGVRIMDVKLTGPMSGKYVMVQPANVVTSGAIAGTDPTTSNYIYSPVWLVR
jgi:Flp pilus assembly protein TadG